MQLKMGNILALILTIFGIWFFVSSMDEIVNCIMPGMHVPLANRNPLRGFIAIGVLILVLVSAIRLVERSKH